MYITYKNKGVHFKNKNTTKSQQNIYKEQNKSKHIKTEQIKPGFARTRELAVARLAKFHHLAFFDIEHHAPGRRPV